MTYQPPRPSADEAAPFYARYINGVEDGNILMLLEKSLMTTAAFLENIPDDAWEYRYAPNKWTIKEVILHVIDTERIMAYRALRIARGDQTPILGFDENEYVPHSAANDRSVESIIEEFNDVRMATLSLFSNFNKTMWHRTGNASGNDVTVNALAYIIAGHEMHHLQVIIERYLS